ncbi:heterokaryon incompatibility protein-domain-containing protein [Xylariaceae sp. FL1019]|nr:heterokaryon incompatibility protein-domain-containing protein [Xylariaceae sp. FL1019]
MSCSGHYDASITPALSLFPSYLQFAIIDFRPWEDLDLDKHMFTWREQPRQIDVPEGSKPEAILTTRLPVLTNEHDPARAFGVGWVRGLAQETCSDASFAVAAGWLDTCLASNPATKRSTWEPREVSEHKPPPVHIEHAWTLDGAVAEVKSETLLGEMPFRLIETSLMPGHDDAVRLIETASIHDSHDAIRFATLSYCWGPLSTDNDGCWRTTTSNLKSRFAAMSMKTLPSTLRDGIVIARKLTIPYIWIDALCIVQDDPDDWARESAKMSGIYLGSILTIAVPSGVSVDSGCFNAESQAAVENPKFHESWVTIDNTLDSGNRSCLYISTFDNNWDNLDMYQEQVLDGPLARRAWTLQEQALPQRTLYYTSKQLMWKCSHCLLSEDNFPQRQHRELYPIMDIEAPLDSESTKQLWYEGIVERYSNRSLTYRSDKLVAISALARATYLNRHIDYVAGLWKDCILSGMLWKRESSGFKNKTYLCPTWSWASQESSVSYKWVWRHVYDESMFTPRVMDVRWKTGLTGLYGDTTSAYIELMTRIKIGTVTRDYTFSDSKDDESMSQSLVFSDTASSKIRHAGAVMDDERVGGGAVLMAIMSGRQTDAPILLLLEPPSLTAEQYRRVGIARLDDYSGSGHPEYDAGENPAIDWISRTIKLI